MDTASRPATALAEPMSPLHIFVGLRGRIPRKIFWIYGVAVPLGLGAYVHGLLGIAGVQAQALEGVLNAGLLWSALAVSVKRWHDRNKSGWWALVQFIPLIGWIWTLIENGLRRGTVGRNRFGDDLTGQF